MIIIFLLILTGVYLFKRHHLSNDSSRQLSWIIVNITNPVTLLCAALSEERKIAPSEVGVAFLCFVFMFAFFLLLAYIIPPLLGVKKDARYSYRMLTIFGNVGFIGIPFSSAILGKESLLYVSICCLTFNLVIYTYGASSLRKTAALQHPDGKISGEFSLRNVINSGTAVAIVTIIVYLTEFKAPVVIKSTLDHIGSCTTFLSMIVLGVSVAQMVPKEVFTKWRLYVFVLIRQILVPIALIFILKPFVADRLVLSTVAVMAAMPAANLPLMMSKQFGVKEDMISAGIILTTLASVITIPVVMACL